MKEILLTVLTVLVASCIFNSVGIWMGVLPYYQPYNYPVNISNVAGGSFGCKRDDFPGYQEINFTDKTSRPIIFITEITEKGERTNAELPLGANN